LLHIRNELKMVYKKVFENENQLNDFISQHDVRIVSIETKKESYNTGLPLPNGGSFYSERDVLMVWIEDLKISET